jgi:hypothetical protein
MFTRDSQLWNILLAIGGSVSAWALGISDPTEWGLTLVQLKWIQAGATILVGLGKLGNSPLQSKSEARAEDRIEAREDAQDAKGR